MSVLISVVALVVTIGLLVTVHEWGHFWVARRLGVRVLRFSVGFGRPLWSRIARDGTEYVVAAVPLGGYVKMLDERDGPVAPHELGGAFNRRPVAVRAAVIAAGPLANFLFAVLAYWALLVGGVPGLKPLIGEVAPGSPAAIAGLEREDEILAVDGEPTPTWEAANLAMLDRVLAGAESLELSVRDRDGDERAARLEIRDPHGLTVPGALQKGLGLSSYWPSLPAKIGEVVPDGAAARAGVAAGDELVAVDGEAIADWRAFVEWVQAHPGKVARLTVRRDGVERDFNVAIDTVEQQGGPRGMFGAYPHVPPEIRARLIATERYGPLEALPEAVRRTGELSALTLRLLWKMLTGGASLENISGPINIAQYAGVTASIGPDAFLAFLAVISVSLGVLNLLPIPILDGGQLAYLAAELLKGSPVSARTEALGQQVGLVLLVLLMGLAFYNDIVRLLS